jgi:hypothetical protein
VIYGINPKTRWAINTLFKKKFEDALHALPERHDFKKDGPPLSITVEVSGTEFDVLLLTKEVSDLKKNIERRSKTVRLEFMNQNSFLEPVCAKDGTPIEFIYESHALAFLDVILGQHSSPYPLNRDAWRLKVGDHYKNCT